MQTTHLFCNRPNHGQVLVFSRGLLSSMGVNLFTEEAQIMVKNILTVEDSPTLRELICFTLNDAAYQIIEAENGQDALNKLNGCQVDMVITDLNMPHMNGIELTRNIRARDQYKYIPILFLSTESRVEKKEEAKKAGATGWLVKPFKPEQLIKVVQKVLR